LQLKLCKLGVVRSGVRGCESASQMRSRRAITAAMRPACPAQEPGHSRMEQSHHGFSAQTHIRMRRQRWGLGDGQILPFGRIERKDLTGLEFIHPRVEIELAGCDPRRND